jgi:hypothetical protein
VHGFWGLIDLPLAELVLAGVLTASIVLAFLVGTGADMGQIGRSPDWLKMKNPAAPAVSREAEEDWGK